MTASLTSSLTSLASDRPATAPASLPSSSAVPLEPIGWVLAAPLFVTHEWVGLLVAAAAITRLISLGAEGWLMLYLAGQPIVHSGLLAAELDLPVLAVTGLLTNALCIGYWATHRKSPQQLLTLLAFLAVFALAAASMVGTSNELTQPLRQRIQLFLSQGTAAILLLSIFLRASPRLPRLTVGAAIVVCGVAAGMLLTGARLFSRMHDTPLIDWGRASAISTLVFLVAATFSKRWRSAAYFGLAGLAAILSVSQLLRQSAYAAILSVAVCAVAFRHVRSFHMTRLLVVLATAAASVAVLQGDLLEDKLGRFLGRGDGAAVSNAARDSVAELATDMIAEQPITGAGFGGFSAELGYDYYPHNMVLEILCEFGVIGLLAGLVPVAIGYRLCPRTVRSASADGEIALAAVLLFWGLVSQASYSIPHSCACFPGLLVGLIAWQRTRPPRPSRPPAPQRVEPFVAY